MPRFCPPLALSAAAALAFGVASPSFAAQGDPAEAVPELSIDLEDEDEDAEGEDAEVEDAEGEDAEGEDAGEDESGLPVGDDHDRTAPPANEQPAQADDPAAPAENEGQPVRRLDDKGDADAAPGSEADPRPFGLFQDLFAGVGDPTDSPLSYQFLPFMTLVGGGHYEFVHNDADDPNDQREGRFTTVALARMGVLAQLGKWIQLESEIEFNAGPYGTSVWEGQAAIQVRNQLIRATFSDLLYADKLVAEAGRITDPTSLNFFSMHNAAMLLTDAHSRAPLLYSGFNRGNGVQVRYTLFDQLTLGLNVNAGNPTSSTGTLQVGGTFPPFSRFYEVPQSSVGRDARGFPTSSFHVMLVSPSVRYEWRFIKAQLSAQGISANTNTNSTKDEAIMGLNVRGGFEVQAFEDLFWDNRLTFFLNGSRIGNGVVDPDDLAQLQPGFYESYTGTTGFDFNVWGKSGFGLEAAIVRETEPGRPPAMQLFGSVGATWWITNTTSLGGRLAVQQRCSDLDCSVDGRTGAYVTLRTILGPASATRP